MPRFATPLKLQQVVELPPGMHADGNNLYLHVSKTGARSWVFRYLALDGKRRDIGLGSLRRIDLERARNEARKLCVGLYDGVEPISRRVTRRSAKAKLDVVRTTFGDVALAYIDAHKAEWAPGTLKQWNISLRLHVLPKIGKLSIADVDTDAIYGVLKPLWEKNANTGSTIRSRIELILGLATAKGLRQGDNPARWGGHLEFHLASPSKAATVEHRAALAFKEMPGFMRLLRAIGNSKSDALEFAILTSARIGEVLQAEWSEIDFVEHVWIVPAIHTKGRKEHRVPLSDAAVAVLERQKRRNDTDAIFVGGKGKPMHTALIGQVLFGVHEGITIHGFRSTFRDWAAEMGQDRDLAEMALGHAVGNHVERSYRRTDLLEKRRALMQEWANFCNGGKL